MNVEELKKTWEDYNNKLDMSIRLNMHCLELIQTQKVRSKLKPLLFTRLVECTIHIVAIVYLGNFTFLHYSKMQFALPAFILILFWIIAFSNCIRQVITIKEIDYSRDTTDIQKKLAVLQLYTVNYVRLTFLMLPTYLAFPIIAFKAWFNYDITIHFNHTWWICQIIFSIILIPVCTWLYKEISYRNIHKKTVRFIVENLAGNKVKKAMEFVNEIENFKIL